MIDKWQHQGFVTLGIATGSPHTFKDPKTGKWSGIAVDILNAWAATMHIEPRYVDTTWDNMIAGLVASRYDIGVSTTPTPTRALAVVFTESYFTDHATAVVRNDAPVASLEDMNKAGMKIATTAGTVQEKALTDYAAKNHLDNFKIVRLPTNDEVILAFQSKRADAMFLDVLGNRNYHTLHPDNTKVVEPNPALSVAGSAFSMRKDACFTDIAAFNVEITDLLNNGEVEAFTQSYMK
ncbi:substrate-binding periplasmic protein [Labrys monachus]|uniref:Polar amino acid transport system substrate-binding protein n=1 Tax=Labrys monachus TaxID=217067 RepID=A0ABU0FLA7_9HYPH|nr:ABC transporter substrate-binding protein [Labrys monachus]MDQ0394904.1 polar amino acid transport system substrate-binding protein [Labrys monachus]